MDAGPCQPLYRAAVLFLCCWLVSHPDWDSLLQDDPKYKQALKIRNSEARLRAFLAVCGSMRTDDSGGQQPKYRMENFRIMAEFEKPKVRYFLPSLTSFCLSAHQLHLVPSKPS